MLDWGVEAAPYCRSCAAEETKSAITDVSYVASQTSETIYSKAIESRLNSNLTVLCTMASYAACHFRQDAHRRMAFVASARSPCRGGAGLGRDRLWADSAVLWRAAGRALARPGAKAAGGR